MASSRAKLEVGAAYWHHNTAKVKNRHRETTSTYKSKSPVEIVENLKRGKVLVKPIAWDGWIVCDDTPFEVKKKDLTPIEDYKPSYEQQYFAELQG